MCYGCLNKVCTFTFHHHSKYVTFIDHAGTIWELAQRGAEQPRNRGSIHKEQEMFLFPTMFRSAVESNQTPMQRVPKAPFTKVRWSGREADQSLTYS
jgi:hypothetical protein